MKKLELGKRLAEYGWRFLRQDGAHELWTNGEHSVAVPRHREINEYTARAILQKAANNKGPQLRWKE